tara:strand:- start:12 stop:305 length:294 start_codon:yes stop_codon:yes gene_type:complete
MLLDSGLLVVAVVAHMMVVLVEVEVVPYLNHMLEQVLEHLVLIMVHKVLMILVDGEHQILDLVEVVTKLLVVQINFLVVVDLDLFFSLILLDKYQKD